MAITRAAEKLMVITRHYENQGTKWHHIQQKGRNCGKTNCPVSFLNPLECEIHFEPLYSTRARTILFVINIVIM